MRFFLILTLLLSFFYVGNAKQSDSLVAVGVESGNGRGNSNSIWLSVEETDRVIAKIVPVAVSEVNLRGNTVNSTNYNAFAKNIMAGAGYDSKEYSFQWGETQKGPASDEIASLIQNANDLQELISSLEKIVAYRKDLANKSNADENLISYAKVAAFLSIVKEKYGAEGGNGGGDKFLSPKWKCALGTIWGGIEGAITGAAVAGPIGAVGGAIIGSLMGAGLNC